MLTEIIILFITFLIVYFIYIHRKTLRYFDKHDLKYLPGLPVFGNTYDSTFLKKHMVDDIIEVYNAFPHEKYVGYLEGTTPIILIRDPEIIKNITVKEFDHFVDHTNFLPETDPLFGRTVFALKGDKWRSMRNTLSPAFTGSKMRLMVPFMTEVAENVVQYIEENINSAINVSDIMHRYTNDVIASAGFGLQVNSFKDRHNEFYETGQGLFNFTMAQRLKLFMFNVCPSLAKALHMEIFLPKTQHFFRDIVKNTIEYRKKNNVERPDMIQLLMEASAGNLKAESEQNENGAGFAVNESTHETLKPKGNSKNFDLMDLVAQVFIFFSAGFETSSGALVMCVHELALNPEVQEKLYQEIKEYKEKKGNYTYDNINELGYLDAVMNETLRKWAAAIILDRVCNKPYELPPTRPGAKPYVVKPGDILYNVVNAINLDPKYYPNPQKFEPERFTEENKHNIQPFTFVPFGVGPRACIGMRFAILEIKVLLFHLVLNFKISKCSKTADPIELATDDFNVNVKGGSWVKMEERKKISSL